MFRNFLFTALRQLWRHKLHTFINVVSLTIGLTIFIFCFLYVKTEFSYDRSWPDAERIHRLTLEQRGIPGSAEGRFTNVNARIWPAFLDYFGDEYEFVSRSTVISVQAVEEGEPVERVVRRMDFVDPAFLDIFRVRETNGSLQDVRDNPGVIAISREVAEALGERAAIGARLMLRNQAIGSMIEYEVGAHFELPEGPASSQLRFQMLAMIDDRSLPLFRAEDGSRRMSSWEEGVNLWVKLAPGTSTAAFNAMQAAFADEKVTAFNGLLEEGARISEHLIYTYQPITEMHFNPVATSGIGDGDYARVATFAIVGLLVLLAGCSNSVGLSLATAIERRREIGIRKAAGALPGDVLRQHLGEALLLVLLAMIPTLAALHALLPNVVRLSPYTFFAAPLELGVSEYVWLISIALGVGLLSGLYPALVLSRVRAQHALKPGAADGSRSSQHLRNVLVAVQFGFAAVLLIATSALYLQLQFTRQQPLGYDSENLLYTFMPNGVRVGSDSPILNELREAPGVVAVQAVNLPPNSGVIFGSSLPYARRDGENLEVPMPGLQTSPGFFRFMGVPLLAGRSFDETLDAPVAPQAVQSAEGVARDVRVLINQSAARALGYTSPQEAIGRRIFQSYFNTQTLETIDFAYEIVGVVDDSMYLSASRRPGPELYRMLASSNILLLRYAPGTESTIREAVETAVAKVSDGLLPQSVTFLDVSLANAFRQQANESRLLLICGALALLLACTGLFGLASFTIERNLKEVGVRKVLGSSVPAIVRLYLWRFSLPVLVAGVLAWPVAAWFVLQWIEQFPYQMDKAWLLPLGLGTLGAILAIALLSVGYLSLKAAMSRPVHCLRDE